MVVFSPEHGLASTISISAKLDADVSVDFEVKHFQSLEGDQLERYKVVSILGFVLAAVILIEKIYTIYHTNVRENLLVFAVDVLLQVILPISFFWIRLTQIMASKDIIFKTVGTEGLSGVPWASRSISFGNKIEQFFDGLENFESKIAIEGAMASFYFVHATAALFRLIFQTSAHPRTALVNA